MGRILDSAYTAPDPAGHFAGHKIYGDYPPRQAADWQTIGQALNAILARIHAKPVVMQAWADDLCQQETSTLTTVCRWKIPRLTDAHQEVRVICRAEREGASASLRLASTESGDTLTLSPAGVEGFVSGALSLEFDADGYDVLTMEVAGDGTDPAIVHSIGVQWVDLATLPTTINGVPLWDENELDPLEPLTSSRGRRALAQLVEALSRRQVYLNWSGLESSSNPNASSAMDPWPHRARVPIHPGTEAQDWRLRAHVYAAGIPGSASSVIINHGDYDGSERDRTALIVPDGAAAAWYSTEGGDLPDTIRLPEPQGNQPFIQRHGYLGLWPEEQSTAAIKSVMLEGL